MKKINASINMEQKLNDLLAKDLGARLPYGVKCKISDDQEFPQDKTIVEELTPSGYKAFVDTINCSAIKPFFVKPYLRPMSSMTEEEKKEFNSLINGVEERCINAYGKCGYSLAFIEVNDWLNAHYFDYRGLIPMGLALEAPTDMYK